MGAALIEEMLGKAAGEKVRLYPDLFMINDGEGHKCIELIDRKRDIRDKEKVVVILDHDIPAGSFESAANQKKLIEFSKEYGLKFIQSSGIGYQVLLDDWVGERDIVVSCGTHNSIFGAKGALGLNLGVEEMAAALMEGSLDMRVPETVKVILKGTLPKGVYVMDFVLKFLGDVGEKGFDGKMVEFTGNALENFSVSEKTVLCSMVSNTGAVSALINEDPRGKYVGEYEYDLSETVPCVTLPGSLYCTKRVTELKDTAISAGFIGGCMGGRIEDLRVAADILKGNRVRTGVRLLIGSVSNDVYLKAVNEGLIEIFLDSGAQVTNPGCGSCRTTSIGVVGDGEVLLTTGSYNYPGCAGTVDSKVFIASAATVAKASITGYIGGKHYSDKRVDI